MRPTGLPFWIVFFLGKKIRKANVCLKCWWIQISLICLVDWLDCSQLWCPWNPHGFLHSEWSYEKHRIWGRKKPSSFLGSTSILRVKPQLDHRLNMEPEKHGLYLMILLDPDWKSIENEKIHFVGAFQDVMMLFPIISSSRHGWPWLSVYYHDD
jgi:hypothetical protein